MTPNKLMDLALEELLVGDPTEGELDEVLEVLAQMTETEMSMTTTKELAELSRSASKWVRAAVALRPRLPKDILKELERDLEPIVREAASRVFRN